MSTTFWLANDQTFKSFSPAPQQWKAGQLSWEPLGEPCRTYMKPSCVGSFLESPAWFHFTNQRTSLTSWCIGEFLVEGARGSAAGVGSRNVRGRLQNGRLLAAETEGIPASHRGAIRCVFPARSGSPARGNLAAVRAWSLSPKSPRLPHHFSLPTVSSPVSAKLSSCSNADL